MAENRGIEGAPEAGARWAREAAPASGRGLRFALIAAALCLVSGASTVVLMTYVAHGLSTLGTINAPAAPAPRLASLAAVAAKPPHRAAAKVSNTLIYAADASGHFFVDGWVNGAPVRFLVDTGATFVALSPADAAAAGYSPRALQFNDMIGTANGMAHVARTTLRSVRLGQLEINDVSAAVMEQPMPVSLLGMSFLSRIDGYDIRDGVLTIDW